MPFGYTGQNQPNQTVNNSGVFSITDVAELQSQGKLGGSLELIEEQTYSSAVSFLDFTSIQESKYDVHFLTFNDIGSTTNSTTGIQFYESGTLETASVYQYARQLGTVGGTFVEQRDTATGSIPMASSYKNAVNYKGNGYVYFYNLGDSAKYSFCTAQDMHMDFYNNGTMTFMGAVLPQASTVDGFRITLSGGNFTSFNIKLYGVKQI